MSEPLERAILRKAEESSRTKLDFFATEAPRIAECAERLSAAFERGARLFSFGNGGSACDAEHLALEFMHPVIEKRPALPASALGTSSALLSAIGNDQDFSFVFAAQLAQLAREGDIALGISTSGKSASVLRGLAAARERRLLVIGFSGRDGGRMTELCDFCFTVQSFSIHRIQEVHETLIHVLWDLVHVARGAEDVLG
ncbi:MAG TPA: SIS domain-containing protein [Polyangiaceae bacterium]|nr:SIS domain-containing protein [Polyangiaceae bacterium]